MSSAFNPNGEMLRVTGLHAFYGESHILHGIDLHVNRGELVTLLGRNGSGRSTTLKAMLGLVGRRSGSVMFNGTEINQTAPHRIARLGLGYCPEERGIFAGLSTEENLLLPPVVASGGMTLEEIYELFPNLKERRNSPGTRLSVGGVSLPRALADLGLIDEYEFLVQPVIAGHGPTLLSGLRERIPLELVDRREFQSGAVVMRYRSAGAPA